MVGSHTVSEYPLPAITRSGGDASQTVTQNTAITTITYTASNATGIALSNGCLPTGVTGSANGLVFTISGVPSAAGTFGYAVTASHTNGCASTSSGTLAVFDALPPYASSTYTYQAASLLVSSTIHYPECDKTSMVLSADIPDCRSYNNGFFYNAAFVRANSEKLCPSPWRVPTPNDAEVLAASFAGVQDFQKMGTAGTCENANCRNDWHWTHGGIGPCAVTCALGGWWGNNGWTLDCRKDNEYAYNLVCVR
jgi:hypothetical protein